MTSDHLRADRRLELAALDGLRNAHLDQPLPAPTFGRALADSVIADAAHATGCSARQLIGVSAKGELPIVRAAVVWALRTVFTMSWPQIARALARDHSTVMHGFKRAAERRETDHDYRRLTDMLADRARERTGR